MVCNLIRIRKNNSVSKGPVLLVHGAGVRAQIFSAPTQVNFIRYLGERDYDVWLENWRGSIELSFTNWTLDQVAIHDHPFAVRKVVECTGVASISAVIHCQGSTSFTMALAAGLLPEVHTVVSNAVSMHTVVPWFSKVKLNYAVPLVSLFIDHLNPQWGLKPRGFLPRVLTAVVELTHHECHNAVCKQVSFAYGTGFPALWSHKNLNEQTHEWLKYEFAKVPLSFFKQMARCVNIGHLVSQAGESGSKGNPLPSDFIAQAPKTDARIAFFSGRDNLCFLPASQRQSFEFFSRTRKDHSHYEINKYGHLDMFMGEYANRDIFPLMVAELEKKS